MSAIDHPELPCPELPCPELPHPGLSYFGLDLTASPGPGAPESWPKRWERAAIGPQGFWRRHRVGPQFSTPAVVASALLPLITDELRRRPELRRVVEIGAGDGVLTSALDRCLNAPRVRGAAVDVVGVDLRPPPEGTETRWLIDSWSAVAAGWTTGALPAALAESVPTMIIAVEWLDELPVVPLLRRGGRLREVLVDRNGRESLGAEAADADRAWADDWWPGAGRVESGRLREVAWTDLLRRLGPAGGSALLIDYGEKRGHRTPSLRGYAAGRPRPAVPDGTVNLTADVAVDALAAAGERAGALTTRMLRLADLGLADQELADQELADLGPAGPAGGPADPLARLAARSARAALTSRTGFGRFWWLSQDVSADG